MKEKLEKIKLEFNQDIKEVKSLKDVENIKVKYFGKSGFFAQIMPLLKNASNEEKPVLGALINDVKKELQNILDEKNKVFEDAEINAKLQSEKIDITLPAENSFLGGRHPINLVLNKIFNAFRDMGFSIYFSNEMEKSEYNFDTLNIPQDHPARDSQDTFYLDDKFLLRSHTTTFQNYVLKEFKPPIKMVNFGKVYRGDEPDPTHMPVFYQFDVMVVDKNLSLADLKGFLVNFAKKMFGEQTNIRLRPSFFPFTEPSCEVDVTCVKCGGKGCTVCKKSGWVEILGGGMIHNNVLENAGVDSNVYSGFALGIGIDRIVMSLTNAQDLRMLYENDIRFLKQYK